MSSYRLRGRAPVVVRSHRVGFAMGILLSTGLAMSAEAQFSPGPLSQAHQELEGTRNCSNCHGLTGNRDMEQRCLACHKGIASLRETERGLHGHSEHQDCYLCHAEHKGADHRLIDSSNLDPETFDHAAVGYGLKGKHRQLECKACHQSKFQEPSMLALEPRPDTPHAWIGLRQDCSACHSDPHAGRLGVECSQCHVEEGFHTIERNRFDHATTLFGLRGAHKKVDCEKCHGPAAEWKSRPAYAACGDCHADPHARQATLRNQVADCSACHVEERFSPSSFTVAMHDQAPYRLEGKHRGVTCEKCHPKDRSPESASTHGSVGIALRPPHDKCRDCHSDPHGGQLSDRKDRGECAPCHAPSGWKPSVFGLAAHQSSRFPLEGRHAKVSCQVCHDPSSAIAKQAMQRLQPGKAGIALDLGPVDCLTCHLDPHEGKYPAVSKDHKQSDCLSCHSLDAFRPSTVDAVAHSEYGYRLEGAHLAVPCLDCHRRLERGTTTSSLINSGSIEPAIIFAEKHGDCADCHKDPHAGQFSGSCARCHDPSAFRPARRFNHDRDSKFSLQGAHAKVECKGCHPVEFNATGTGHTVYKSRPTTCQSCHTKEIEP